MLWPFASPGHPQPWSNFCPELKNDKNCKHIFLYFVKQMSIRRVIAIKHRKFDFWHAMLLFHAYVWITLQWGHDGHDGVSNHQPHHCLLNRLFGFRSKKTSKLRVTGLCVGNSPGTSEFPTQKASNAENVSIWWRHNDIRATHSYITRVKVYPLISHGNIQVLDGIRVPASCI